jgi:hypothetical protein
LVYFSRKIQLKLTVPSSSKVYQEPFILVGTATDSVSHHFITKNQNTAVRHQRPILSLSFLRAGATQNSKVDDLSTVDSNGRQDAESPRPEEVVETISSENASQLVRPDSPSTTRLEEDDSSSLTSSRQAKAERQTLGRNIDVTDLDDDGWLALSESKKILPLKSLGEGAGGSVTKCVLEGGSTVFAVKVCLIF